MNAVDVGAWNANWAWSLPLIVLNVVIHVIGLGLINESVVRVLSGAMERRRAAPCEWLYRRTRLRTRGDRQVTALYRTQAPEPHQRPRSRRRPAIRLSRSASGRDCRGSSEKRLLDGSFELEFHAREHGKSTQNRATGRGYVQTPRGFEQLREKLVVILK